MKEAARRELGVSGRFQSSRGYRYDEADLKAMREDVRHIYDRTQEALADRDTVSLYRGVALSEDEEYADGIAESWTTDRDEAAKHAKRNAGDGKTPRLFEEEVPVSRVLMYSGGPEWHDGYFGAQKEFVVLPEVP